MKTEREGREITVAHQQAITWRVGDLARTPLYLSGDTVALWVENMGDPQESVEAQLTPAEARQLAAELVRLADEIEQE